MRLSQAIRLGALLRPQAFGAYVTMDGKTCAMGAGLEAEGVLKVPYEVAELKTDYDDDIVHYWPWVAPEGKELFRCPLCAALNPCVGMGVILHLNDRHRWSREQIADWVEGVEPKEGAEDERKAEADDRRIPDGAPGVRDAACIGV